MIIKLCDVNNGTRWVNTNHIIYWTVSKGNGHNGADGSWLYTTNGEFIVRESPDRIMSKHIT